MDQYKFPCDPVVNPEATITGATYRFTVLDDRVLRYEWAEDGHFEDRASTFALFRNFPKPVFRVVEKENQLEIITPLLHLIYDKQEFSPHGLLVRFTAKLTSFGAEWRYGQAGARNLGGTARTLDEIDGRCDMGLGVLSRAGWSLIDDTNSMLFDDNGFVASRRPGKRMDGYLFGYGTDYKGAMASFFAISGQQPSMPRWSLGNWWSRYHAYDHTEYLAVMDKFKKHDIPLSVACVDIHWHWFKEPFVPFTGWTGYSWNTNYFPSPTAFTKNLHDRGLTITLNDHPHSGVHSHEDVYEEVAKVLGHDTTNGDPIHFDSTSPEFMHAYFNTVHRKLEDIGCDFWWIDWQQGPRSRTPGFDPLWILNHFQFLDTKQAKPASHPLILSRYAGPGSHRYPIGFSGDTFATWDSLRFLPEFTATASNIGFGWWSHDIGGHKPGERNDECTTRWVQFAVFSPILRYQSHNSRWMSREPWLYRQEYMLAMRAALQFRHRLVPYIFSVAAPPQSTLPLVQPLYWSFPTRDVAYRYPNQYFFGPSLVVSPIVGPRDTRTNLAQSKVWVPPRRHVDIFTGVVYDGDRELDMYRSLDGIPVLAPEGSIIPLEKDVATENGCKNPDALEVIVVVGQDGHFDIIEEAHDDRDRRKAEDPFTRRCLNISFDQAAGQVRFDSGDKAWRFRFISARIEPRSIGVHIDGRKIPAEGRIDGTDTVVSLQQFHPPLEGKARVSIDIGADPQLTISDHTETIDRLLHDFQMKFLHKDRIWEIIQADQPRPVKIGRLLSLDIDPVLRGPILELLLADSRV